MRSNHVFLNDFARTSGEFVYAGILLSKMREFGIATLYRADEPDMDVAALQAAVRDRADALRGLDEELEERRGLMWLQRDGTFETKRVGDASPEWRRVWELRRELRRARRRARTGQR